MKPSPYPRVPHLVAGRGTRDDLVLGDSERVELLRRQVVVEEKLDGSNVMLWWDDEWVAVSGRAGPGAQDRARQLGPLRAWAAERAETLRPLLNDGTVLYGEWLLVAHTVAYDRLPSYVVGLDVLRPDGCFEPVDARDERLADAGLQPPPQLFRGVLGGLGHAEAFVGQASRVGSEPIEGVVIRTVDGDEPRIAKLLAPGFSALGDEAWNDGRPKNRLSEPNETWG